MREPCGRSAGVYRAQCSRGIQRCPMRINLLRQIISACSNAPGRCRRAPLALLILRRLVFGCDRISLRRVSMETKITLDNPGIWGMSDYAANRNSRFCAEPSMGTADEDYIVSEDEVLAIAGGYENNIFVDLDETLYLQNSTADFTDYTTPGNRRTSSIENPRYLWPWRRAGGRSTRDTWRIRYYTYCIPIYRAVS